MNRLLKKVKMVFEKEYDDVEFTVWDEKDWQAIEIPWEVHFCIDKGELQVSFWSNVNPAIAAGYINMLHCHGINDFWIMENVYPSFDDKGEYLELLFGMEADQKYLEVMYEDMRKKADFMRMVPTAGTKQ